jgi:long-chain acyl-CoA synthetase
MSLDTIRDILDYFEQKQARQDALLIKEDDQYKSLSRNQLTKKVHHLGRILIEMGVAKGDKIGMMAENRLEWPITYLAVTCIGAIIAPISILWESGELEILANNGDLKMIFTSNTYLEKIIPMIDKVPTLQQVITFDPLESPVNKVQYLNLLSENLPDLRLPEFLVSPEDTAEILFVNVTLGVELSHRAIMANVEGIFNTLQLDPLREMGKKSLMLLPFSHLYPSVLGVLMPLLADWTAVTAATARIDRILRIINETKPNYIFLVPLLLERFYTRLNMRLKKGNKTLDMVGMEKLEFLFTAGVKCPEPLIQNVEQLGLNVLEGYGVSEMAPFITFSRNDKYKRGSAGFCLENGELMIHSPNKNGIGEVVARGPNMMKGYYNKPQPTEEITQTGGVYIDADGWLHTGDIGYLDEEGFLFITGRLRNIIVTKGGTNVYPTEIEKRLLENQYIANVKIIMRKDDLYGEYPFALIQAEKKITVELFIHELNSLIQEQIQSFNGKMAAYKIPKGFKLI